MVYNVVTKLRKEVMKMKNSYETLTINGRNFKIGYQHDIEFSGYVFCMKKQGEWHGVLLVNENNRNWVGIQMFLLMMKMLKQ